MPRGRAQPQLAVQQGTTVTVVTSPWRRPVPPAAVSCGRKPQSQDWQPAPAPALRDSHCLPASRPGRPGNMLPTQAACKPQTLRDSSRSVQTGTCTGTSPGPLSFTSQDCRHLKNTAAPAGANSLRQELVHVANCCGQPSRRSTPREPTGSDLGMELGISIQRPKAVISAALHLMQHLPLRASPAHGPAHGCELF